MRCAVVLLTLAALAVASLPANGQDGQSGGEGAGVRLPDVDPVVLESGTRLFLLPDASVPLVTIHVRLPGGVVHDAWGEAGRAALLAEWVRRGAGERDAAEFRQTVQSRGGWLTTHAAERWIGIDAEFLAEDLELALSLIADVLDRPRFEESELTKARDLELDALTQLRTQPSEAVDAYWNAWLFGDHPWGHRAHGDELSLQRVADPDALRARWKEIARPANRWIALTGDFDPAVARALLPGGPPAEPASLPLVAPTPKPRTGMLLVDHPEALQTYFRFGGAGFDRTDPDHASRYLANTILGGRFTSRLNKRLRTEEGLTYGARSSFDDERGGAFAVNTYTQTATSLRCIVLAYEVYNEFVAKGMTAEELASARTYVKGQYAPDELETPAQQAAWLLDLGISGLSRDFIDGFFARLDAVTLDEVNHVITTRFPRSDLSWVVIGRVDALAKGLENLQVLGIVDVAKVIELADPGFGPR